MRVEPLTPIPVVVVVRDGSGTRHERFSLQPDRALLIGRGWHCDIIVQDPLVDAEHAVVSVSATGELACRDLASKNGSRLNGVAVSEEVPLASGNCLQLGRSSLDLYLASHEVKPAVNPSRWDAVRNLLEQPRWALCSLVLLLASSVIGLWSSTTADLEADSIVGACVSALGGIGVWVLFWGVISKLLRNSMHLSAHLSIAATFGLLGFLINRVSGYLGWQTLSVEVESFIESMGGALLLFAAGVLTLGVATRLSRRSLLFLSALPPILLLASIYLLPLLRDEERDWYPNLVTSSYPPGWLMRDGVELDKFLQRTPGLFSESTQRALNRAKKLESERQEKERQAEETASNSGS